MITQKAHCIMLNGVRGEKRKKKGSLLAAKNITAHLKFTERNLETLLCSIENVLWADSAKVMKYNLTGEERWSVHNDLQLLFCLWT